MSKIRLYIDQPLADGLHLELNKDQAHYLTRVMRKNTGDNLKLFNGKDGEWLCQIIDVGKKSCNVKIISQTAKQKTEPDIWLCFAPVKNSPINFIIQKATELGVSALQPIYTNRTVINRVNTQRMEAIAIEAAEQSERNTIPLINQPVKLEEILKNWDESRNIILCDESGGGAPANKALSKMPKNQPYAIFIGPEGGFTQTEFEIFRSKPYVTSIGMGPRILRADTAALAALTCFQNILGDWDEPPSFRT
ncbi:16S rRNA (uracil(1498)-N(3))-methyltransferase [Rickettsiales bacterium]|nr:16S rRNA (uracil(1498)-N(3))-methyltransferase [Rickettsiales bacterium]